MDSTILLHSTPISDFKLIIGEVIREQLQNFNQEHPTEPAEKPTGLLTRREVAQKLKITLVTLDKYTRAGTLQSYKIGGQIRYKAAEIEKAFEQVKNAKYRRG